MLLKNEKIRIRVYHISCYPNYRVKTLSADSGFSGGLYFLNPVATVKPHLGLWWKSDCYRGRTSATESPVFSQSRQEAIFSL